MAGSTLRQIEVGGGAELLADLTGHLLQVRLLLTLAGDFHPILIRVVIITSGDQEQPAQHAAAERNSCSATAPRRARG